MSRRKTTGLRKPSTKLGAHIAAKRSAASDSEPRSTPDRSGGPEATELEASAVDRPTMPEVPEARRSSSGESGPPAAEPSVATESGAHDDELSLSSSFFASEPASFDSAHVDPAQLDSGRFDSLAPISTRQRARTAELHDGDADSEFEAPSPAQLARQARMRRIVFGVVGAVAVTMLTLVAAQPLLGRAGSKHAASGPTGYATDAMLAAPAPLAVSESKPSEPKKAELAKAEPANEVEVARSEPAKEAEPAPSEPAKADPAKTDASAEPPARLTQSSVRALERGKRDEAIELASRSIEADPTDALPYLIKGSAFLEKGDMKSARAAFDACMTHAKRGATYECAAMGGKKQR